MADYFEWQAFMSVLSLLAIAVYFIIAGWYRAMGWPSTREEFDRQRELRWREIIEKHRTK